MGIFTADEVCVTDGLRVWIPLQIEPQVGLRMRSHEPGTVDLTSTPRRTEQIFRQAAALGRAVRRSPPLVPFPDL